MTEALRIVEGEIHVRFKGRSETLSLSDLGLTVNSSDNEIRSALSRYLDSPDSDFRDYDIDRNGRNVTIRPSAVFG